MRYYSYDQPVDPGFLKNEVVTVSENEILDMYYDFWYDEMCKKYGKEKVDANFTYKDCIDDWVVVNWAWESN